LPVIPANGVAPAPAWQHGLCALPAFAGRLALGFWPVALVAVGLGYYFNVAVGQVGVVHA